MPNKNKKGGKGHRRGKAVSTAARKPADIAKQADLKGEVYGCVRKALGNKRFLVRVQKVDNPHETEDCNCGLKGSVASSSRRTGRVRENMFVLVQRDELTDTHKDKGTIIDTYTNAEVAKLMSKNLWDFVDAELGEIGVIGNIQFREKEDDDGFPEYSDDDDTEQTPHPSATNITTEPENLGPGLVDADADIDIDAI